jgi:hypothetical protein
MDDSSSTGKRKRPTYLPDFLQSDSESDGESKSNKNKKKGIKKVVQVIQKNEQKPQCLLCSKSTGAKCSISDTIGTSEHTLAEVLSKLFQKEHLPTKLKENDLSKKLLCVECKDMVEDLFRLQDSLRGMKNKIVSMFKKSQKSCGKNKEAEESCTEEPKTKQSAEKNKKVKKTEKEKKKQVHYPEDDVYIIELLKEKKGNKFLVKWENFSEDEDSWEPQSSIPDYMVQVNILQCTQTLKIG